MGLDFDALEYCKNVKVKQSLPPYSCPVSKCGRNYKTVIGLQYHLLNYDHDNPQPITSVITPNRKKARSRGNNNSHAFHKTIGGAKAGVTSNGESETNSISLSGNSYINNPESLVAYNEEQQTVTFNIQGKSVRLGIHDPLPFIDDEQYNDLVERGCILNADAPPLEENAPWAKVEVPKARFQENFDYNVPDASPRSLAYYRFIEKSTEELDGEIEYDVDEEDSAWLEWMNEEREKTGYNAVAMDTMELLMDRLEKESYFQAAANGTTVCQEVDDDAVCCICMDGECQNSNVILFCDMCNLAVHQDCYGVPYIPEGQWLCRRCLQSPSTPVNCVLCPNTGGAFKQTDRRQWVHVVCALWIPEVRFANTVFLEPIDSIETIPAARWRLTCYVCKEKGMGACIQCHRNSCYAAFHVTCAQQAGLYMTMDMNEGGDNNESSIHVQKYAFCHAHTPEHAKSKLNLKDFEGARHKMKEARKALAKKRSTAPVVLIPTIPSNRIQEIASMVHMQKKKDFLDRLIAYWTLKRKYRNGVPLLRRLQSQGNNHGVIQRNGIEGFPDTNELYRQLKYWQSLRQDLERARLLCELVRKREKLKAAYVKICEQVVTLQLNPLESLLTKLLNALESRDTTEIFRDPVDTSEVPDYLDIVSHPMDLGTMRTKLQSGQYSNLDQMQADFDLMIQNCLAYNNKDTVFYRAGIRMRDQATPLFQEIREALAREGLLDKTQSQLIDHVEKEVEEELRYLLTCLPCEAIVQKLLILADKSQVLKNPSYRTKKIKQIRLEISRMRKTIQKSRIAARHNLITNKNCHSEGDDDEMEENHYIEDLDVGANIKSKLFQKNIKTRMSRRTRRSVIENHIHTDDYDDDDDADGAEEEGNNRENNEVEEADINIFQGSKQSVQTPPNSPSKCLNNSASPVGVNRRTAVLFTRKAQAALKKPMELPKTPIKEENNATGNLLIPNMSIIASTNNTSTTAITYAPKVSSAHSLNNKYGGNVNRSMPLQTCFNQRTTNSASKSPKRNSRHKRLSEVRNSGSLSPKKSPSRTSITTVSSMQSIMQTPSSAAITSSMKNYEFMPDKFRVYRTNNERDVSDSDEDDMSNISGSPCSSCSGFSISCTGSEYETSNDDDDDEEDEDDDDDDDDDEEDEDDNEDAIENDRNETPEMVHLSPNNMPTFTNANCNNDSDRANNLDTNTQTKNIIRGTSALSNKRMHSDTRGKQKKVAAIPLSIEKKSICMKTATHQSNKLNTRNTTIMSNKLNNVGMKKTNNNSNNILSTASPAITTTNNNSKLRRNSSQSHILSAMNANSSPMQLMKPPLEPLQLVWAKCRGYPWYPALILDPNTPKGFVYNGVPLPAPPSDVLALRNNYSHDIEVFLVLFFDVKRTWQWLPCNKLEILGIDKELDQQKLVESRKPTERKAVKKAYQDALHYQSQVSDLEGQGPDPIM